VLDTENELFQSKRSYVDAEYDLSIAYARTQAGMGNLFNVLGLARPEVSSMPKLSERNREAATGCPNEGPATYVVDKAALDARAQELVNESIPPGTTPAADGPIPALSESGAPVPAGAATSVELVNKAVNDAVNRWAAGWVSRNLTTYLTAYSVKFVPPRGMTRDAWITQRRQALANSGKIELSVENLKIELKDATHATTTFRQVYRSDKYQDVMQKTIDWENTDGRWLIIGENAVPMMVK